MQTESNFCKQNWSLQCSSLHLCVVHFATLSNALLTFTVHFGKAIDLITLGMVPRLTLISMRMMYEVLLLLPTAFGAAMTVSFTLSHRWFFHVD